MDSIIGSLSATIRTELLHREGVTRFSPNRRFATLFSEGMLADSLFYLESGLVKLCKHGDDGKEIIVEIVPAGRLFGEEALSSEGNRSLTAEILLEGVIYVIPREVFLRFTDDNPWVWRQVSEFLITGKARLEKKIEMISFGDVESRILYYLADLAASLGVKLNGKEYAISLSQSELASIIGATRETTSTTLNSLARRGLIRLGRRQLILVADEPRVNGKPMAMMASR